MDKLQTEVMLLFKEEHQDWVQQLKKAEETGEGVDVNLGGKFADRIERLMQILNDCRLRNTKSKKKGFFGG